MNPQSVSSTVQLPTAKHDKKQFTAVKRKVKLLRQTAVSKIYQTLQQQCQVNLKPA